MGFWRWQYFNIAKPNHAYASCDSFLVELIVVDINGCNDTIENTVVVHCLPEITSLNTYLMVVFVMKIQLPFLHHIPRETDK